MSTMNDIEVVLTALQTKQSKYKYNFITEWEFNQKVKQVFKRYRIIKFHTEVIEHKRFKIQDSTKIGSLNSMLMFLVKELEEVDST